LGADQIGGPAAAGEVGREFPELALDLQLERLPAGLRGADLRFRFALLRLMHAPPQGQPETDLRQIPVGAVAVPVDRPGFERDVRIPALVGQLLTGRRRGDLRVAAGERGITGERPLHQGIRRERSIGGQGAQLDRPR
jgi:hypothetical protein